MHGDDSCLSAVGPKKKKITERGLRVILYNCKLRVCSDDAYVINIKPRGFIAVGIKAGFFFV